MSATPSSVLDGWVPGSFTAAGFTRETFRRGSGPGVIVIHEIPGITPKVAAVRRRRGRCGLHRGDAVAGRDAGQGADVGLRTAVDGQGVRRARVHALGDAADVADHLLAPCAGALAAPRVSAAPASVPSACASAAGSRWG